MGRMDIVEILLFAAGLGLLVAGAEALVRGAARLAGLVGVSPLVVGLTVVAYGTSTPELAVSVRAALGGQADISLGNVVGSNTCNILLILGLSALVAPLTVNIRLVRSDVWVMIGVALAAVLLGLDGRIGRIDGLLLAAAGGLYTTHVIRQSRRIEAQAKAQDADPAVAPRAGRRIWVACLRDSGRGRLGLG